MKPVAESCEQNKAVILDVLRELFSDRTHVLEIGSGTGQHAVHFGAKLSHLRWQTSELPEHHAGIQLWLEDAALPNVLPPLALDVRAIWPDARYDAAFSANTVHIMAWDAVEKLFEGLGKVLAQDALFALYGPFNYGGRYSSESNARFDDWLKQRDPLSGIRDFDDLNALARTNALEFHRDIEMPVNNRILVWRKV